MQPLFNAFANQTQSNSSTSTLPQMQAFRPNMLQNSVPMQPQTGIMNPQVPFPLSNSNMPATAPLMNQNNFMNASNPLLIAQSNHLGLPQLGHMFPVHGNFGNMPLNVSQGQLLGPNLSNLPQQFNQNMGFSNGQMCLQSVNQLLSMQMSNPCLFGNPQFGLVNQNQQNFVQPIKDVSGNNTLKSCSSEPRQGQNLQPSAFMRSQRNFIQNGQGSISKSNSKKVSGKNFIKNRTKEFSQGFQKSHFHQMHNGKRKFGFYNDQKPKGHGNGKAIKFGLANQMNQPQEKKRKSLALTYTEQEVKQWCEERRKNYPTKANINKKLTEKQSNSDVIDKEAKMRREQLKEILAKQAELGVEVAEIPSYYLLDSKKQVRARVENTMPLNKRGRFQNNYDKRGRYKRKDQFSKEQKLADKDSSNTSSFNKKKPTLLQKLLSADVKRDKSHLLQTFRFMAINSFFKDWPEKPVNFPLVMVKDGGAAGEVVEEKSLLLGEEDSEGKGRRMVEHFEHDENRERMHHNIQGFEDENDDEEEDNDNGEQMKVYIAGKGNTNDEHVRLEEEEGEIID
ncbi:hypothetical protein CISIN_1g008521mg [Citrus sinensis]|uniref:FMR1-interacting protein 1 conserved domain-containing protein n=1 Tax=Citrus sinensis TaxID=2711 RepID=A0A067EM17_CITSI|nr:hypothetical protein CISIN_1g008521mg [Citrus sinensis]